MEGENLKIALAKHDISAEELAKRMKRSVRAVYDWFMKDKLKPTLAERICAVTDISIDELTRQSNLLSDTETPAYGAVHHGKAVQNVLNNKGVKIERFAKHMKLTRGTMYKRFAERTWDEGELMHAAEILHVPVAQLKGKGEGYRAFEKDIYEELKQLKVYVKEIHQQLVAANTT